mgnify:CR=1 FL=1
MTLCDMSTSLRTHRVYHLGDFVSFAHIFPDLDDPVPIRIHKVHVIVNTVPSISKHYESLGHGLFGDFQLSGSSVYHNEAFTSDAVRSHVCISFWKLFSLKVRVVRTQVFLSLALRW